MQFQLRIFDFYSFSSFLILVNNTKHPPIPTMANTGILISNIVLIISIYYIDNLSNFSLRMAESVPNQSFRLSLYSLSF